MKTHKVVKSEGVDYGINFLFKTNNLFMKVGNESEIRKYFDDLYLRSLNKAKIDTLRDCPMVLKSKNQIRINTINDTVILFEIKKLTSKERLKYN